VNLDVGYAWRIPTDRGSSIHRTCTWMGFGDAVREGTLPGVGTFPKSGSTSNAC
jgi:hypothetical protein